MKTVRCLIVILVAVIMASAAVAQAPGVPGPGGYTGSVGVPKSTVMAVDQQLSALQSMMKQLMIQSEALKQKILQTKKRIEEGAASAGDSDMAPMETQAMQIEEQIKQVQRAIIVTQRLQRLSQPVDITLKSSTIRQAAEALSRASKLSITVDPKVPQDVHVNADAQNVPLGAVLEVIANAAGLIIAPTDDGGLLLRMPGKLVVDGTTYMSEGSSAPFSNDWGIVGPYRDITVGQKWLRLFDTSAIPPNMPGMPGLGQPGPNVPGTGRSW
jgi:hypothetical protein